MHDTYFRFVSICSIKKANNYYHKDWKIAEVARQLLQINKAYQMETLEQLRSTVSPTQKGTGFDPHCQQSTLRHPSARFPKPTISLIACTSIPCSSNL